MKKDLTVLAIFLACFIGIIAINQNLAKPSIYITHEYDAISQQGPCKVIEYTINGVVQLPVTLYNYEGGRYENFMAELEKEGRVTR